MAKILISTIIRNRESSINKWYDQLLDLLNKDTHNDYYISIYENDSTDSSKNILKKLNFSMFTDSYLKIENINSNYYESIKNEERVNLLANARNKSIFECNFLNICDYILCIEPDITYNPQNIIDEIINKIKNYDILSSISNYKGYIPYDSWATRKSASDKDWDFSIKLEGIIDVYSTFNCLCIYKSEPFKKNAKFSGFNDRFKEFDCDTSVICEKFINLGYSKIAMNCNSIVNHL
jgi:hypothetical protein